MQNKMLLNKIWHIHVIEYYVAIKIIVGDNLIAWKIFIIYY